MKTLTCIFYFFLCMTGYARSFSIHLPNGKVVITRILTQQEKERAIAGGEGRVADDLYKEFTARTIRLIEHDEVLLEFLDRTAMLFSSEEDYKAVESVRFTKDKIWFLRPTLSYHIPLALDQAQQLVIQQKLTTVDLELEEDHLKIYKVSNELFLVLDFWENHEKAAYYPTMKSIASEYDMVAESLYPEGPETYTKEFINGKFVLDLEPNHYFVYPNQLKDLIRSHELTLIEENIKLGSGFVGELLYKSRRGYFIVIDDFDKPVNGRKPAIGRAKIFSSLSEVRDAQRKYEAIKDKPARAEHFYQELSDNYGIDFPDKVADLISILPSLMNIDADRLDYSVKSIALVNESIQWNHNNDEFHAKFIYPSLAYYAEHIKRKAGGKWVMKHVKDEEHDLFIPSFILPNGKEGIDVLEFCKGLYEGPVRMEWAARVYDWENSK